MTFSEVCKVYQRDDKFLVLNPLIPSWIVTNINGVLLLKLYAEDKSFESIASEFKTFMPNFPPSAIFKFLEHAKNENLFDIPSEEKIYKTGQLKEIYLNITDTCNLHCIFCIVKRRIENEKFLTLDDYKKLIDEAMTINPKISLTFTGGEPLTSSLTIPVAEYAKKFSLKCSLMTNGTLIDEKNVDTLTNLFSYFQISIDGSCSEIHDYYRGKGNFDKSINAVNLLLSKNAKVNLAMVANKKNLDDVKKAVEKWGDLIFTQPIFPFGNEKIFKNLRLTGEDYYKLITKKLKTDPYAEIISEIKANRKNNFLPKCTMGDIELSISRGGDVFPCPILHHENFKVGNITEKSFVEIYNSPELEKFKFHTVNKIEGCRDCDFKLICGGSCQARNFCETGNLDKVGNFCEYDKLAIVDSIINSAELQEL